MDSNEVQYEIDALTTVYDQLEEQIVWAMSQGHPRLAAAYQVGQAHVASKLVELTMGAPV